MSGTLTGCEQSVKPIDQEDESAPSGDIFRVTVTDEYPDGSAVPYVTYRHCPVAGANAGRNLSIIFPASAAACDRYLY